jgi:DNA-binding Xre family transcriptional regulator
MSITQKKVKDYLGEKGWSIVTASEKSGLPVTTIKSIIYGKSAGQRVSTLEKLAKAFDCSVNDLITDLDDGNQSNNEQLDTVLFKECIDAVELYLQHKPLSYSKQKIVVAVDSLFSLLIKKKRRNLPYSIDNDTIEWIFEN